MPTDPQRVQAVFALAMEADPAQRAALLDRECGADLELRQRVEALLKAFDDPASVLNQPAAAPFALGTPPTEDFVKAVQEPVSLSFLLPSRQSGSLGRLGHYEVLEVLGQGGFGIVLRAYDEKLQRMVAIKVLTETMAATSPPRKRFLGEARAAAGIRHEHVVQIYAVEEQPRPYLVMEYIPGRSLQEKLDGNGPLEISQMLRLAVQIARGLAAAHAQGLIHRDIKPGNILLEGEPEPRVKITDFGLARAADDASLTQSGIVAGTPPYMSPEQAKGDRIDQRSDLFIMGSVFYVMLSGRLPFRAPSALAILKRVCEDEPRPIPEIIPDVPAWLCGVIAKLHAKNPDDRFQTAQEVADLLEECLTELKAHGKLAHPPRFPAKKTTAPKAFWGIGAATVVLLLVLVFNLPQFAGRPGTPTTAASTTANTTEPQATRPASPVVIPDPGPAFLDSRAYLPLSENQERKVVDFQEIHGATPEALLKWAETLEPGYVPVALGDHATANPNQFHAIAVKLTGRSLEWKCQYLPYHSYQPVTDRNNRAGFPTIGMQYSSDPEQGLHILLLWVKDLHLAHQYGAPPTSMVGNHLAYMRSIGHKPLTFVPYHRPNPAITILHSMVDNGRGNWQIEVNLTVEQLATFASEARAKNLYPSMVAAYRNEKGETRFGVAAWENPAHLDWAFQAGMTAADYETALAKRKQDGMRPVSVTSYDDKGTTRYAASWVRYVTR